jgi:aryl carrier-like protein
MVPSFLVPIRQLPINASGKLNRASLPRPTSQDRVGAPKRGRTFRAAESEIATRIVAAAIGADVPAPDVSLFDLGVNSLQLMQIAARFQSAYGVDVQLGAFFRRPTVEVLATMLAASLTGSPARHEQAPDVVETARSKPLETEGPISLNQRRILENPYLAGSDEAVMQSGFSIAGPMDVDAFKKTVLVLQQQHRVLRTWITASSSTRQTLQSPVPVRDHNFVHLAAQSRLDAVRAVACAAKMAIAGLHSRPLFSVDLCHLEANDHAVVITVHHAIFDGWSWGVLLKSMNAIYAHLVRHEHPPAAPAAIDYISFAAAQSEHLASAGLAHKKGKPCLVRIAELACACGARDAQKAEGLLRLEAWERTKAAATNFGISPFCVLLSAFGLAVSRRYGVTRFSVFVPSADRISTHVQEAVGYFANAMQIDFEFAGDSRFEEIVATVQRQVGSLSATPDYTFGLKDVDRHIRQTGMGSFVFAPSECSNDRILEVSRLQHNAADGRRPHAFASNPAVLFIRRRGSCRFSRHGAYSKG